MISSRALYYPTIDIRDEEWLKTAFLFWDGISTIVPKSLEGRAYNNYSTQYLEGEGYLQPVTVNPDSEVVRKLVERVKRYADTDEGKACLNQPVPNDVQNNPYMDERSQFYLHHEKLPFEIQQLIADKLGEDGWARVSDNFANYYMTLLANAIANKKFMTLLTSATPLANLTARCTEDAAKRLFTIPSDKGEAVNCQAMLVKMIIDSIQINPLTSFDDLKLFKRHHADELDNFRGGLDEISGLNLPEGIDYNGMVHAVKDIYDRKVLLPYKDLKAALSGSRISFLENVSSLAFTGITTTYLETIVELTAPQQLLAGTGIYVAVQGIKVYRNRRALKRASKMSYLLSIDRELRLR